VDQSRAGDQNHVSLWQDSRCLLSRSEERQLVGLQRIRVLFEHQEGVAAALQLSQKRDKGADDHHPVASPDIGCIEGIDIVIQLDTWMWRCCQQQSASALTAAIPTARRIPCSEKAWSDPSAARRPRILPGNGIAIAELGQHTASGIDLIGVALVPAAPLLRFHPGEKETDNHPVDLDLVEFRADDSPDRCNRIAQDRAALGLHKGSPIGRACRVTLPASAVCGIKAVTLASRVHGIRFEERANGSRASNESFGPCRRA
jgi:hypothetical protein